MSDDLTRMLVQYTLADHAVDPDVRREAARRILDSLAVALAAVDHPGPVALRRFASRYAGVGASVVWGTDWQVPAEIAGFVNGAATRCLDYNDSYFGVTDTSHPSDMIGSLVAVAEERGRSGAELLDAIAVGYEVAVHLVDALTLRAHGWDQSNITALGACAGAARLLQLSPTQAAHAYAITVVPHAVMQQTRHGDVQMWKGFGAPEASGHAVAACLLAEAGVEGPAQPFEGFRGFLSQLLEGEVPYPEALRPLREVSPPRAILTTHMKKWPFGYVAQSAVAAALEVHEQIPDGDELEAIRIRTFAAAMDMMGSPEKWAPKTRETADHSFPYVVASALRDGTIGEETFATHRWSDPEMHRYLRERVTVVDEPDLTAGFPAAFPSIVEATLKSGAVVSSRVDYGPGHAKNPFSDEELEEKFRREAGPLLGVRTEAVLTAVAGLESLGDVRDLTALVSTQAVTQESGALND